jgi:hypothetical protein
MRIVTFPSNGVCAASGDERAALVTIADASRESIRLLMRTRSEVGTWN